MRLRYGRTASYIGIQQEQPATDMDSIVPTALLEELLGLSPAEAMNAERVQATLRARLAVPAAQPPATQEVHTQDHHMGRSIRMDLPKYQGHGDAKTPSAFISAMERFATAQGISQTDLLQRAVPVALSGAAQRWWDFHGAFTEWESFKIALQREFGAINYIYILKRELEARTQHPDEPLSSFIQSISGYYDKIGEEVEEADKLKRVLAQMHPEFRRFLHGRVFNNLKELASAGPDIQGDILQDRMYRPPPPPSWSIEPSLAWGEKHAAGEPVAAAVSQGAGSGERSRGQDSCSYRHLSYAAIDPFMKQHVPAWAPWCYNTAPQPEENQQPRAPKEKQVCYTCGDKRHFSRNCPKNTELSKN